MFPASKTTLTLFVIDLSPLMSVGGGEGRFYLLVNLFVLKVICYV